MVVKNRETTSDWLFDFLSEEIIQGRLKSQEKISEPEIARQHNVSRAPVREAIRRLEERSLVTRKPHSGPRVASFCIQNFLEIFEIREALEGTACRLAAERIGADELNKLGRILKREEEESGVNAETNPAYRERRLDFHYLIAQASRNRALIRLLCEDYYNLIKLYRIRYNWLSSDESDAQAIREHYCIFEALKERDGTFAEILMRRHIAAVGKKTKQAYDQHNHPG